MSEYSTNLSSERTKATSTQTSSMDYQRSILRLDPALLLHIKQMVTPESTQVSDKAVIVIKLKVILETETIKQYGATTYQPKLERGKREEYRVKDQEAIPGAE